MAKEKKEASKEYVYNKSLEGCKIGAKWVVTISESTSQKDLKMLHEAGIHGIVKVN